MILGIGIVSGPNPHFPQPEPDQLYQTIAADFFGFSLVLWKG